MISNFFYQKNVDQLHERMKQINRTYQLAFRLTFYVMLVVFLCQLFYNGLLLFTMSLAWLRDRQDAPTNINWRFFFPDPLIYGVPPLCILLSYCSFYRKMQVVKMIFFLLNIAYFIACIVMLTLGYDSTSYTCAILLSGASLATTISCLRADADDKLLSKIPGYPKFDPLLMQDIESDLEAREQVRYREKPAEVLMADRDREYLEKNPDSEAAIAERERQEIERGIAIENWLDEMLNTSKDPKDR